MAINQTSPTLLGETSGAWVLGLLTFAATIFLGFAALTASRRANQIAGDANRIAADAAAKQAELLLDLRKRESDEGVLGELEGAVAEMARLAASNPLPPLASREDRAAIERWYYHLISVFAAFQAFGANMQRAIFLAKRLEERGCEIVLRGGRHDVFAEHDLSEHDRQTKEFDGILSDVATFLKERGDFRPENEGAFGERYEKLQSYWSQCRFNLPVLSDVKHRNAHTEGDSHPGPSTKGGV